MSHDFSNFSARLTRAAGVPCNADLCVGYTGGEACSPTRSRSLLFALTCAPTVNPPSSIMETGLGTCECAPRPQHFAAACCPYFHTPCRAAALR